MKERIAFLLAIALLICMIPAAAFAADPSYANEDLQAGYYIKNKDNIDLIFAETKKTVKINSEDVSYYPGSVKFSLTVSGAAVGKSYIVLVSSNSSGIPQTADELYYMDQKKAANSTLSFDVYPKATEFTTGETEKEYTVLITSDDESVAERKAVIGFAKAGTRLVKQSAAGDTTVSINDVPANVTYGDSQFTLSAIVNNPGSGAATYKWTSSNNDVLSISAIENVATVTVKKASAEGALIKLEYADETKSAECSTNIIVSPKELTLPNAKVLGRAYDSTTKATISAGALSGVVSGDDVALSQATITGEYESPYVGQNITVSAIEEFKLIGDDKANYTLIQPTGLKGNINLADQKFTYTMNQSYTKPFTLDLKNVVKGDALFCPDLTEHLNLSFEIAGYKIGSSDYVTTSAVTGASLSGSVLTVTADASDDMQLWFSFTSDPVNIGGSSTYEYVQTAKQKAFCITIKDKEVDNSQAGQFYDPWGLFSVPGSVSFNESFTVMVSGFNSNYNPTGEFEVSDEETFEILDTKMPSTFGESTALVKVRAKKPNASGASIIFKYENDNYIGQTSTPAIKVLPKELILSSAAVQSKQYDGTTAATILASKPGEQIILYGAVPSYHALGLASNTISASFDDPWAATNKAVTPNEAFVLTDADAQYYTLVLPEALTGEITTAPAPDLNFGSSYVWQNTSNDLRQFINTDVMYTINGIEEKVNFECALFKYAENNFDYSEVSSMPGISLEGNIFKVASDAQLGGYMINVTASAIDMGGSDVPEYEGAVYNGYNGITLFVAEKPGYHTTLSFESTPAATVTYSDIFTVKANVGFSWDGTDGTPVWTWEVSDPSVFEITSNGDTATVKAIKADSTGASIIVTYEDDSHLKTLSSSAIKVSPKQLTLSGTAVTVKTYDGTTTANITAGALNGIVGSDTVSLAKTTIAGTFASQYAGNNITVTAIESFSLTGVAAANYSLQQPTELKGNITAAEQILTTTASTINLTKDNSIDLSDYVNSNASGASLAFNLASAITGVSISASTLSADNTVAAGTQITVKVNSAAVSVGGSDAPEYNAAEQISITVTVVEPAPVTPPGGGGGGISKPTNKNKKVETVWKDINIAAYYYEALQWGYDNGIIDPVSEDKFGVGSACTRADAFLALYRAAGSPKLAASVTVPFKDIDKTADYYDAVCWAYKYGYTNGSGNVFTFAPTEYLDRAQIVTILWRYAGSKMAKGTILFNDLVKNAYYVNAVDWATANGVVNGTSKVTFSPNENMLRESTVTVLYRYFVKPL